jgi:hypothetical protein
MAKVKGSEAQAAKRRDLAAALGNLQATLKKDYIDKIEKQAELFLQEQLKSAIAITQRAITLAAIFGAITASIVGVCGTLISKGVDIGPHIWASITLVVFLLTALGKTVTAAKPESFYYAGSNPVHWLEDVSENKDFQTAQIEQVCLYSQSISDNGANLKKSQSSVASALNWAGLGLLLFTVIEVIVGLSSIAKNGLPTLF